MKLYFVRHGESTANLLREFSNNESRHPLTDRGIAQAQALVNELAGIPCERIYTSPVLRAVQTALILAEGLKAPLEVTPALREWDVGIYEGTTDPAGWELHRQVQEDWFYQGRPDSKMPSGESFLEIQARTLPFLQGLLGRPAEAGGNLLLVAHGGLYTAMLPHILINIDYPFAQTQGFPNTGVVIAEPTPAGLTCLSWCGVTPGQPAG